MAVTMPVVSMRKRDKETYEIDYHVANFKIIWHVLLRRMHIKASVWESIKLMWKRSEKVANEIHLWKMKEADKWNEIKQNDKAKIDLDGILSNAELANWLNHHHFFHI